MFSAEATATGTASPGAVWALLLDVPAWPQWYPGYTAAESEGALEPGRRGTVTLADGRRRPFEVFEWTDGTHFSIGTQAPGSAIRFHYTVRPHGDSGSTIVLGHTLHGPTSRLFGWLFGRRVAAYLPIAAPRLARLAEERSRLGG